MPREPRTPFGLDAERIAEPLASVLLAFGLHQRAVPEVSWPVHAPPPPQALSGSTAFEETFGLKAAAWSSPSPAGWSLKSGQSGTSQMTGAPWQTHGRGAARRAFDDTKPGVLLRDRNEVIAA